MIFLTVGTQFPFDRLVRAVDQAAGAGLFEDPIFAQVGASDYQPRNFEFVHRLDKGAYDEKMRTAARVISHAGMGSITMALEHGRPLLVMPRRQRFGEVVNNHQLAIAQEFEAGGYLVVAYDETELYQKLKQFRDFTPRRRLAEAAAVSGRIRGFLEEVAHGSSDRPARVGR